MKITEKNMAQYKSPSKGWDLLMLWITNSLRFHLQKVSSKDVQKMVVWWLVSKNKYCQASIPVIIHVFTGKMVGKPFPMRGPLYNHQPLF